MLTIVCNATTTPPPQPKALFWVRLQCAPQSECQSSSGEAVVKIGKGQVSFSGLTLHSALFTPDLFYQSHAGTQPSWPRCVLSGRRTLLPCYPPDWSRLIPERNTSNVWFIITWNWWATGTETDNRDDPRAHENPYRERTDVMQDGCSCTEKEQVSTAVSCHWLTAYDVCKPQSSLAPHWNKLRFSPSWWQRLLHCNLG